MSVGRNSTIIPAGKRLILLLIADIAKKMMISSNIAKRKREDDWDEELYSYSSNYVLVWNKYGNGEVATFCITWSDYSQ